MYDTMSGGAQFFFLFSLSVFFCLRASLGWRFIPFVPYCMAHLPSIFVQIFEFSSLPHFWINPLA